MKQKTLSRMDRLEQLTGLLKSEDYHTAASLSKQLSVSTRTLMRDLDILKEKGLPIETDRGRGGGIRLHRFWGIGRLNLNYHEVIDLLLSLAIMEQLGSPLFLRNVKAIRYKISASFPEEQRNKVQDLRKRILLSECSKNLILNGEELNYSDVSETVYEAFFEMKNLNITYTDVKGIQTKRRIEAHYLFLNWPIWYLMTWDHLRQDVRCFRLDRISEAELDGTSFKPRARSLFTHELESFTSTL